MSDKSAIIKEAQKYLARGQVDKAIAEWEKLIKEYPDGNTFNTIGDLYLKKGDKNNAVDSYHKAADFFRQEGFSLKALALFKKILNINPADAISLISLGELNEGKGLVTDAIKFYLAAADTLSKEGNKEKLLEIYNKILALSPTNIPLRSKIAEIYTKENLLPEAALQYLHIAGIYNERGESEKSIGYYRKVLDIQPVNKEAILDLSSLYEKTGDFGQAIEQMNEAGSLFPDDADVLYRSAELYISAEKFGDARNFLRKITELEPGNTRAKKLLGDTYMRQGEKQNAWKEYLPVLDEMLLDEKYDDAIKLLKSFKDIDPVETGKRLVTLYMQLGEYPQIVSELTSLGTVYSEHGKQKEALNCFKEALKMSPDDDTLKSRVVELEKTVAMEEFAFLGDEKTIAEAIIEADIYLRYGLYENAKSLLEPFRQIEPENTDIHARLKSLYTETDDKEQAVTECLTLNELFSKAGDSEKADQMIREAHNINPEDPRLIGMEAPAGHEEGAVSYEAPSLEDYSEEIAEADFYARQGLMEEAREILERLQSLFPENNEIIQKLDSLGHIVEQGEKSEGIITERQKEPLVPESEVLEAEEITEPALDSDVMDIFNEFKKGLEKELEEEDYETHYNLGIAYKEMGLIDDAIREFQSSRNDPKKFIHSSNMLGICYMEKGLYPLAIDILKSAIEKMEDKGESYWAMRYDLAEAYEKNGNTKEAYDIYTEVYGWNSKFRAVSDKINQLRAQPAEGADQKKPKDRKDRVSYI